MEIYILYKYVLYKYTTYHVHRLEDIIFKAIIKLFLKIDKMILK